MILIKDIITALIIQCIVGFFAWVAWQIAAAGIAALPSIPVSAGIALWILWFMMICLPIFLATYKFQK